MFVNVYECVSECLYHTCVHGSLFVCACICVGVCTTYNVLRTLYHVYKHIFATYTVCVCDVWILLRAYDINTNQSNRILKLIVLSVSIQYTSVIRNYVSSVCDIAV